MNTADSSANKASAEQLISMSVNSESAAPAETHHPPHVRSSQRQTAAYAPAQPAGSNWNGVNPCQGNPWNEVGRGLLLVLFPMLLVGLRNDGGRKDCLCNDGRWLILWSTGKLSNHKIKGNLMERWSMICGLGQTKAPSHEHKSAHEMVKYCNTAILGSMRCCNTEVSILKY